MQFKDIKSGYPVYFLDRESVEAYQGKVVSVAVPRYDAPTFGQMQSPTSSMVVDVTIEANGSTKTYTMPEASETAYAGSLAISSDKPTLLREVEAIKSAREDALGKMDKYKEDLSRCESILESWNPAFSEKKEQDRRIEGIESEVRSLGTLVKEFISQFKAGAVG